MVYKAGRIPELMACWYLGAMLSNEKYFKYFCDKFLCKKLKDLKELKVSREYQIQNRKIDIVVEATLASSGEKIILVIEAKVDWPDDLQLNDSITKIKQDYHNADICGINFVTTCSKKQIKALGNAHFKYNVVTIEYIIQTFFESGLKNKHDVHLATALLDAYIQQSKYQDC